MFKLTLLLCDNMLVSSSTLASEIFHFAQAMAKGQKLAAPGLEIRRVSVDGQPVKTSSGFELTPTHRLNQCDDNNLIHIPALWRNPRPIVRKNSAYIPWLQQQHRMNCAITAVGTGVCFLAEAGLLNGRLATTHWYYFDSLQRNYPEIKLDRQRFTTEDKNIYCAASINAMAELMMHHIERHYGGIISRQAQRNFFHEIRNLSDPSGLSTPRDKAHSDEAVAQAQIWMQDNLHKSLTISQVATQFGMSTRAFNRRFKLALGISPTAYLTDIRMNFACDLLKNTNLPIVDVASFSGFPEASWFSSRFRQWSGNSPSAYRKTVRTKLFS
jgi:transcriptional regulator GlxA family with amidase domain